MSRWSRRQAGKGGRSGELELERARFGFKTPSEGGFGHLPAVVSLDDTPLATELSMGNPVAAVLCVDKT